MAAPSAAGGSAAGARLQEGVNSDSLMSCSHVLQLPCKNGANRETDTGFVDPLRTAQAGPKGGDGVFFSPWSKAVEEAPGKNGDNRETDTGFVDPLRTALVGPKGDEEEFFSPWNKADEEAQAEAIRTIRFLQQRDQARELERTCRTHESGGSSQDLHQQIKQERSLRLAAQNQVRCLEVELDNREAAVQRLQSSLEQRQAELQKTRLEVRKLNYLSSTRDSDVSPQNSSSYEYKQVRALREQVLELLQQLEVKDMQLNHMQLNRMSSGHLRSNRNTMAVDEVSTIGSEQSSAGVSTIAWS